MPLQDKAVQVASAFLSQGTAERITKTQCFNGTSLFRGSYTLELQVLLILISPMLSCHAFDGVVYSRLAGAN